MSKGEVILRMEGISKSFPGVQALKKVNLTVRSGEVMALLGENGAGKSTLMKVLTGIYKRDSGDVYFHDEKVDFSSSKEATESGISIIHQELNLLPNLKIYENIYLGRELKNKYGSLDIPAMIEGTRKLLARINVDLEPTREVKGLSIAMQQMVEIAKALSFEAEVIVMDEPTGALPDSEVQSLFAIIQELKKQDKAVIYITHRLKEVFQICDRITVFRDGELIGESLVSEMDYERIVNMMVGRKLTEQFPYIPPLKDTEVILSVKGLTNQFINNVSFDLKGGWIVGVAGLAGAGRTELAKTICGVYPHRHGTVEIRGREVNIDSPARAIHNGIFYVSEDRKGEGLILGSDIRTNMTLSSLRQFTKLTRINSKKELTVCEGFRESIDIRTPSLFQKAAYLSGGNQQKVVISKAMMAEPEVLILDEPTRGIDVGAKKEIYNLANELKSQGKAILLISSEMPEVLGISDYILVMYEGELKGGLERAEATQEKIMEIMMS